MVEKNWLELIKPNKLEVTPGADPSRRATLVAQPLERGFGLTLGNALRRILLSSLQGAAVTSIQIDGVVHEFSSIPGVREDVTDIVLNVKQLSLRSHSEGPKRLVLKKSTPGEVTAADIEETASVEILDKSQLICHLDEGASLRMELVVQSGKGYVQADRNRPEDAPIGLVPVDSLYSPVKRVAYRVENTREGQVLDYDRLILEIETDGSVTPEDAAAYAARIMQDQLQIFVNFDEPKQRRRRRGARRTAVQPGAPAQGGRTGAFGAVGQLPEERQHCLYRRSYPEDRRRDAPHPELRPQVAERNQGSAGRARPASRHGRAGLAARRH